MPQHRFARARLALHDEFETATITALIYALAPAGRIARSPASAGIGALLGSTNTAGRAHGFRRSRWMAVNRTTLATGAINVVPATSAYCGVGDHSGRRSTFYR
jgi:hypothetical protein